MTATSDQDVSGAVCVKAEFSAVELGDERLNRRARKIADSMASQPAASLPDAMATEVEFEGCYRLLGHKDVTAEALSAPHHEQRRLRCRGKKTVLAIADTTSRHFDGQQTRRGLGPVTQHGKGHGFRFHPTIAVSFGEGPTDVLGVLASHIWTRDPEKPSADKLSKAGKISLKEARARRVEEHRWWNNAENVEQERHEGVQLIHVMDREADSSELLAKMSKACYRFVLRMQFNRKASELDSQQPTEKLKALAEGFSEACKRDVELSPRTTARHKQPIRRRRTATLSYSAGEVCLHRPSYVDASVGSLSRVNLVRAWERNPPEGEEPVEWFLFTSEPITTTDDILDIVDMYWARCLIEEFFCAIKTGCVYETRQLESLDTLSKALAFTVPIAWQLLRLKMLSRATAGSPASSVLTPEQLYVGPPT